MEEQRETMVGTKVNTMVRMMVGIMGVGTTVAEAGTAVAEAAIVVVVAEAAIVVVVAEVVIVAVVAATENTVFLLIDQNC